jgi:redox-sensitive bicupin YhaK (pirin superfamily)
VLTIRRAGDRGHTCLDWLDSYHTFSFGQYEDPRYGGFRALRVLNEDRIAPGRGFGAHGHRDMEILSYVLSGGLAHRDSSGDGEVLGPNHVQLMTAGSGVIHSEFNASPSRDVHFLQIWIEPAVTDLQPGYQQVAVPAEETRGALRLIAGPKDATTGSALSLHQDARIYAASLGPGDRVSHDLAQGRGAWVQCATGELVLNGELLRSGDGAAVTDESSLEMVGPGGTSEFLLFDLA